MPESSEDRWLALYNGGVYTMDPGRPRVQALLARNGHVVFAGSNDEARRLAPDSRQTTVLDLQGRCALPGLTDSHIHFLSLGLSLERVALSGVDDREEVLRRVAGAARDPGEWVQGWGWDHSLWAERTFPDKALLDRVAPQVPVALRRKDGHMVWLNSAALAAAGITRDTPDPAGGRVGRDQTGEPDGLLFESAADLVYDAIPEVTAAQARRAAGRAMAELHRMGVTGAHVPEGPLTLRTLQDMEADGELRLRATAMLSYSHLEAAIQIGLRTGFGSQRLRIGPVKIFADGSLGSETAAMLEPFEGSAANYGLLTIEPGQLREAIARAARAGIGSAVHAIGDGANRLVLDAFQQTQELWRPAGLRPRIEHVQVLHRDDLPRFAALGVIASMQPIHNTQDMELVDRLWGARGRYAYAFRSLLETGAALAFGSDAPVETADPLAGLYAAVARRRADGSPPGGWQPQERITLPDAVRAYTASAAHAAGLERVAGTLAPGKYADLVVLSRDVMLEPAEALLATHVTHTVFAGEVVYQAT